MLAIMGLGSRFTPTKTPLWRKRAVLAAFAPHLAENPRKRGLEDLICRLPGDQPIAWPNTEEASRAVREYLAVLDAARSDEKSGGGDDNGASGGGRRRAERSFADRSTGGMGRKEGHRPI